jgi:hydroxymethylbilane synthase
VPRELRLGTRGSQLALWQANTVKARIEETGGAQCRIVVIKTSGDRLLEAPLSEIGGKRLFVKEIEDALLRNDVDLAVHSSKDMPAVLPAGLTIAGVLPREDPLDALVLPRGTQGGGHGEIGREGRGHGGIGREGRGQEGTRQLGTGPLSETPALGPLPFVLTSIDQAVAVLGRSPSIGTGSVRRVAQLMRLFPGARFAPIRGNLDTRLRKLDEGAHDALVLAAAGLRRLGFRRRISLTLPAAACIPAPGQGIVAIEIRAGDEDVGQAIARISDPVAEAALIAERALVEALGGGCQTPIGALATPIDGNRLELVAAVVALDGSRAERERAIGSLVEAAALGRRVATRLLERGAGEILADARSRQSPAVSVKSAALTDD